MFTTLTNLIGTASLAILMTLSSMPLEAQAFGQPTYRDGGAVAAKPMKRRNPGKKMGVFTGRRGTAADNGCDNTTFCGCGDVFVVYEEDANGNKIPGTEEYGCTE